MAKSDILSNWAADERFKLTLTFADGSHYSVEGQQGDNFNPSTDSLISFNIDLEDSIAAGNPVGVLSPATFNAEIFSKNDVLNPFGTTGHSSKLRAGVRVDTFRWFEQASGYGDWREYGTFFIETLSTNKENGGFGITSIQGKDMLNFLGNQPIPSLTDYVGTSVRGLVDTIFTKLRESLNFDFEWKMSDELDLDMLYAIAKGDRVRDVLNGIAQALMARIYVDRKNIIQIKPAIRDVVSDEEILGTIETTGISNFNVELNSNSVFNKVRLQYTKAGNSESSDLASTERLIEPGDNAIKIDVANSIILIDSVYLECEADDSDNLGSFADLTYQVSAGQIDVDINNATGRTFNGRIVVTGILTGDEPLSEEYEVEKYKHLQASTLELTSSIIQTEAEAKAYVKKVANYLERMEGTGVVSGILSPELYIGEYVYIDDDDPKMDGLYLITSFSLDYSAGYTVTLNVVKIRK